MPGIDRLPVCTVPKTYMIVQAAIATANSMPSRERPEKPACVWRVTLR